MGMYTELILGARLSKNTPEVCIKALDHVINGKKTESDEVKKFIDEYSLYCLFFCSSYYFGVCKSNQHFWRDVISGTWHISTRANLKNYDGEIEKFLNYIKHYIESGSGYSEIYAFVIYEEDRMPKIYSLKPLDEIDDDPMI